VIGDARRVSGALESRGESARRCDGCTRTRPGREFRVPPGRWHGLCQECRSKGRVRVVRVNRAALGRELLLIAQGWKLERGGETMDAKAVAKSMADFPAEIAKIIGKTFAVQGDGAPVTDDEACSRIRDLLIDRFGERIIEDNKDKRLARR